ncbi:MAG: hypothetical protein R3D84_15030 [Paracoccaceae bacterium]
MQDPGRVIDPVNAEAQAMSGALFGLSAAIMNAITLAEGKVQEQNFPDYDALRIDRCPEVAVVFRESGRHLGGLGEPATPPAAPALANAIFALTGQRIRDLPLSRSVTFA